MSIKFLVLGGGDFGFWGRWGSADSIFMGARIFPKNGSEKTHKEQKKHVNEIFTGLSRDFVGTLF